MITTDGAQAFMDAVSGKVMRIWKYKRMFTPLEQEKKYVDQSEFVDDMCDMVFITGIFEVFGKVLISYCPIEFAEFDDNGKCIGYKCNEFDCLDDIHLAMFRKDTEELNGKDL